MNNQQPSHGEQIIAHLFEALKMLEADCAVTVLRNSVLPEEIDDGGLVIVRDGAPSIIDPLLGDEGPYYKSHDITLELMVQAGRESSDASFDALCKRVTEILDEDTSFGGLINGLTYQPPTAELVPIDGARPIKAADMPVTVEYQTDTRF